MLLNSDRWAGLETLVRDMARKATVLRYVPNEGNAGDALIASATWQFFDDLGIRPVTSHRRQISQGDSVLYSGGGDFIPDYWGCARMLRRCLDVGARQVLVMPHTIRGHGALLAQLDSRFTLVCRDHEGLAWTRSNAPRATSAFAPDMALRLDVERLRARCGQGHALLAMLAEPPLLRGYVRYLAWRLAIRRIRPVQGVLSVFRSDVEALPGLAGERRFDLSTLYGSKFHSRVECDLVSRDFLAVIDHAGLVRTNRLHVGIGGALLGKEVELWENSYGKIRAVLESSGARLERVRLMPPGSRPPLPAPRHT